MSATFVGTVELSPALQCCFQRFEAKIAINKIEEGKGDNRNEKLGFVESVPTNYGAHCSSTRNDIEPVGGDMKFFSLTRRERKSKNLAVVIGRL